MKTILVAIDYSSAADNALDFAAQMAKEIGAQIVLFNVYKLSIHASNSMASSTDIEKLIKKSEDRLIELSLTTEDRFGVKVGWELRKDNTVEGLKDYTDKHSVDLVVMGIESGLIEYKWFGNTTTEAIQLMQFPLLVVPNGTKYNGVDRIMYACDSSYLNDNCNLNTLKVFVRDLDADLEVFHVLPVDSDKSRNEELEGFISEILSDIPHSYRYVKNAKVEEGIEDGLEQSPADLLVMIPHKIGFFESLFVGSNTGRMTVQAKVPLLVIPNEIAC